MTIISFEGLADDDEQTEIPDGYRGLNWKNYFAIDDELIPIGADAIHSGEAAAYNVFIKPPVFKSPDRDDNFDLNSGFFTAFLEDDLKIKVFGYDDGEQVARKGFFVGQTHEFVTFGPKFDDIDEVKITTRGPEGGSYFAVDDLFIDF